jgi:hypothetical protein
LEPFEVVAQLVSNLYAGTKLEKLTGKKYEVKKPDYSSMYSRYRRPAKEKKKPQEPARTP